MVFSSSALVAMAPTTEMANTSFGGYNLISGFSWHSNQTEESVLGCTPKQDAAKSHELLSTSISESIKKRRESWVQVRPK